MSSGTSRKFAALCLAVMAAAQLTACAGSTKPPTMVNPSPTSPPTVTPSATPALPPIAATDPKVLIAALAKQAPKLPSKAPCPSPEGKWRYDGGKEDGQGPGLHVNILKVVETHLDADPAPEVVAYLGCTERGFGHTFDEFVTAFKRDASGTFTAMDVVMPIPPEYISAMAARPSGGVTLTFKHDRTSPGDDDTEMRTQDREFVWESGAFRQVAGGTSIPMLPGADLAITKVTHTRTPGSAGDCSFTFTITMTNKGPVTSGPVLIAFLVPAGPNYSKYAGVNQNAHPPLAVGQTAEIQAKLDQPCSLPKASVFSFTGGADPHFDNNQRDVSLTA